MKIASKYLIILILCCQCFVVFSFPLKHNRKRFVQRFAFGAFYGFYKVNKNHSVNATPRAAALISYKAEIYLDQRKQNSILFGLDYFYHGINFNSYYFKPDSLKLYDKSFSYQYSLGINELALPLLYKYSFVSDKEALFSPYLFLGYNFRFMLPTRSLVRLNGNEIKRENVQMNFKNPLFFNPLNSGFQIAIGFQKNNYESSNSGFFVELMCRANFSPYLYQTNYSANSLFINNTHLGLNLGFKL